MTQPRRKSMPIAFAVLGTQMVGFTIAGIAIDYVAGTMPWLTITLTILGFVVVFAQLMKLAQPPTPGNE